MPLRAFRLRWTVGLVFSVRSVRSFCSTMTDNNPLAHAPADLLPDWMLKGRTRVLNNGTEAFGSSNDKAVGVVYYWMQRDVRTRDNWAFSWCCHLASIKQLPMRVAYCLPPPPTNSNNETGIPDLEHLPMTERHGTFLLGGLECVHKELSKRNIPLDIVLPQSNDVVCETMQHHFKDANTIVVDMNPIRQYRCWAENLSVNVPYYQVDAHNVVPLWIASPKREYGARTIRPKITKLLDAYLKKYPNLSKITLHQDKVTHLPEFEHPRYKDFLKMDGSVKELDWAKPGTDAALEGAEQFFAKGLSKFDEQRNDPNKDVCSLLSPWINFGHVSFQRLALAVKKLKKYPDGTKAYIEEGIIRRELSDNFVWYAPDDYDKLSAAYEWAQETLRTHSTDEREYIYSLDEFAQGQTHDDLWNAAQLQAVRDGKMHGFLRMYWAKKILEWTPSPQVALETAQYLNDQFNLDGRDPNGFVGVGWSIMGIHDQGWKEREVFGKIRFMNYNGCKRKFKVADFVAKYNGASSNAIAATAKHGKTGTKRTATTTTTTKTTKKKKT